MTLKYVGKIKDISYTGNLVARGEFAPRLGSQVFTSNKPLGKVVNIYGPVSRPFITIKPVDKGQTLIDLVGKDIYLKGIEKKRRN